MPPEHQELEADWLADELGRCIEYGRSSYENLDKNTENARLYLANQLGTLMALYNHFRYEEAPNLNHPQRPEEKKSFMEWVRGK